MKPAVGHSLDVYSPKAGRWFVATITAIDGEYVTFFYPDTLDYGSTTVGDIASMPERFRLRGSEA